MVERVIIYSGEGGKIAVVFPMSDLPIEEVAKKDVPSGVPYLFIERATLPDFDFSDAWVADFSKPDGLGIGHDAWAAQYVDPMAAYDEAHIENARLDMWPVLISMAEQENQQWDALQSMKDAEA